MRINTFNTASTYVSKGIVTSALDDLSVGYKCAHKARFDGWYNQEDGKISQSYTCVHDINFLNRLPFGISKSISAHAGTYQYEWAVPQHRVFACVKCNRFKGSTSYPFFWPRRPQAVGPIDKSLFVFNHCRLIRRNSTTSFQIPFSISK